MAALVRLSLLGLFAVVLGSNATWAEVPTAEELLARSVAYHDPEGRFLSAAHRLWFLETRPQSTDRRSEVLIDVTGQRFEMVRKGEHEVAGVAAPGLCEMTLDGRSQLSPAEREEHRISCERLQVMRNYYTYLWGLPMKLQDPGTRLGRVTATDFEGTPVFDLKVTYESGVGDDTWYFYFHRESYALVGYRFYHDEALNDGELIRLQGEVEAEGLRLPQRRTWITHAEGKLLGTDVLLAIAGPAPQSLDNGFDRRVYDRWVELRLGRGEPVYWYSTGEVYAYPGGELLMLMEGYDTARLLRHPERDDVVYQLSRKTYIYRHPQTGEVLSQWTEDGETREVRPIAYPYQYISYELKDGYMETWVEQHAGERLTRIGPGRDLRARKLAKGMAFSAPVILDLDLPGGQRYQAAEHYDFFAPEGSTGGNHISWVRYGDRPRFAGPGTALTHLISWRVDRYQDLPASIRRYVEEEAPLWKLPPKDLAEIRRLQQGEP